MDIKKMLDNFSKSKIVVVGDVMLDSYVYGDVDRVSPEAPVLILNVNEEIYELGGASNVAKNISSLNGNVTLFGYVGRDNARDILNSKLNEKDMSFHLFPVLDKTIQKTRLMGDRQHQIFRMDRESHTRVSEEVEDDLVQRILKRDPGVIIASDYAKGCLTKSFFSKIINSKAKIVIDPKPKNKENYSEAYLITPNLKEAREMTGLENIEDIGRKLQEKYKSNILITQGKEGMTLFENTRMINFPTQAKEVYDVTGAGDTVVAVVGLGLASGLNLEESVFLANHAAGIVVSKAGTAMVSKTELEQVIEKEHRKLKNLNELKTIRKDLKRKGKKVIWTNGCFDILQVGHTDYLKKARDLGNCLFVGLNSDNSVRRLKGEDRPINNEDYRAKVLSAIEFVDYIIIFNETTVEKYLKELKPDIYVKAGDYDINKMHQGERRIIENYGGRITFIPIVYKVSTTGIINKIKNS